MKENVLDPIRLSGIVSSIAQKVASLGLKLNTNKCKLQIFSLSHSRITQSDAINK
jgi:hypothetical protein